MLGTSATVRIGRSEKPVVEILDYTPDGKVRVVFETTTPNGMLTRAIRTVSLKRVLAPAPVEDEIAVCKQLVFSLSDLITIDISELLPMTDGQRSGYIRARLGELGAETLAQVKELLIACTSQKRDLVKMIAIICAWNGQGDDPRQAAVRKAAAQAYQRQLNPLNN